MALRNDFLWGFATAAAQIEGGGEEQERAAGKGLSIWDWFCEKPGVIRDGAKVNKTCDFYSRWREDLALMASLGVNSYRFSISWPRVIPLGGADDAVCEQGLQFYDDVINECLRLGITPFVTLYHWDLPLELHKRYGGLLNKERFIPDYLRYARLCFERYGDRVKHWLTFNEPWVVAIHGFHNGVMAPGHKSNTEPWVAGHTILVAHAHAAKTYQREYQPSQHGTIGITLNGDWAEPWDQSPENVKAAQDKTDVAIGWFADPVYLGKYPDSMRAMLQDRLPEFTAEELELLKDSSEFYGMNFYTANTVKAGGDDESQGNTIMLFTRPDGSEIGPQSDLDWLRDVPWGFRNMLNYLYKRYGKPIYVTENGYAVRGESSMSAEQAIRDTDRVNYYNGYLGALRAAVEEDGVDVRSYYAWSFIDNFEWASGLIPRFGSVRVDYDTFERTPKDSAYVVSEFFKSQVATGKHKHLNGA
ncbi:Beta-glucosidase 1B [Vanrija pseudolonga]|uniref:beta-glucosidase n=1 Tax=Vanrija pseudolonga TaxID=143232 RepID=A0AAF0Y001_9TREE|nr:Beta-glucosidase 1B [Vanrija pseudolonga]